MSADETPNSTKRLVDKHKPVVPLRRERHQAMRARIKSQLSSSIVVATAASLYACAGQIGDAGSDGSSPDGAVADQQVPDARSDAMDIARSEAAAVDAVSPHLDGTLEDVAMPDSGGNDGSSGGMAPPGIGTLLEFGQLATLRPSIRVGVASSTDTSGAGMDWSNYLGTSNGERVLFDELGPGVIFRFWHTEDDMVATSDVAYHFYFDGETTARFTVNF